MEGAVVRAALAVLALTACAHHAPATCDARDTLAFDRCVGSALDQVMVTSGTWAEIDDPDLRSYVHTVGMRLVHAAGNQEDWTFRVVDDPDVSGESSFGNTIYVSRGALARLRDEAELAGLLGHEIGHVLAGHAHDGLIERTREVAVWTHDRDRDDEIQADELAVMLTSRAGYDPGAVETMLRAIAAGSPAGDESDVHPPMPERLLCLRAFTSQLPAGGTHDAAAFAVYTRRLVVSEDPRVVHVVGTAIILARAGLAIDMPHGSQAELASDQVVAAVDGSAVIVKPITRELAHYISASSEPDKLTLIRTGPHGAAMIAIAGPAPRATLALLHLRAPTHAELAALQPQLMDAAAPRKLWPE